MGGSVSVPYNIGGSVSVPYNIGGSVSVPYNIGGSVSVPYNIRSSDETLYFPESNITETQSFDHVHPLHSFSYGVFLLRIQRIFINQYRREC